MRNGTEVDNGGLADRWGRVAAYVSLARPDHWFKNVFVLVGGAMAVFFEPELWTASGLAPFLFALASALVLSSANYVLNEILDAPTDREHPMKRGRPLAARRASPRVAWIEAVALYLLGLAIAFGLGRPVGVTALVFCLAAWAYNVPGVRTKDVAYLDVATESLNLPLRLLLGWFPLIGTRLPPLSLLLAFWSAGAFFMAVKRLAELRTLGRRRATFRYRRSFEVYTEQELILAITFASFCFAFFAGVFIVRFKLELILFAPACAAFFVYYLKLGLRDESVTQTPEKLFRDRRLLAYASACLACFLLLMFTEIPWLYEAFNVEPARTGVLWRLG